MKKLSAAGLFQKVSQRSGGVCRFTCTGGFRAKKYRQKVQ